MILKLTKAQFVRLISSPQGSRPDPFDASKVSNHAGIDIAVPEGTEVFSPVSGTITSGYTETFGNYVEVDDGVRVRKFAHLSVVKIKTGGVNKDAPIALSGKSGKVTGAHLHYSVWNKALSKFEEAFDDFLQVGLIDSSLDVSDRTSDKPGNLGKVVGLSLAGALVITLVVLALTGVIQNFAMEQASKSRTTLMRNFWLWLSDLPSLSESRKGTTVLFDQEDEPFLVGKDARTFVRTWLHRRLWIYGLGSSEVEDVDFFPLPVLHLKGFEVPFVVRRIESRDRGDSVVLHLAAPSMGSAGKKFTASISRWVIDEGMESGEEVA